MTHRCTATPRLPALQPLSRRSLESLLLSSPSAFRLCHLCLCLFSLLQPNLYPHSSSFPSTRAKHHKSLHRLITNFDPTPQLPIHFYRIHIQNDFRGESVHTPQSSLRSVFPHRLASHRCPVVSLGYHQCPPPHPFLPHMCPQPLSSRRPP